MDERNRLGVQHVVNFLAPLYSGQPAEVVRPALDRELRRRGLTLEERYRVEILGEIAKGRQIIVFQPAE